MQKKVLFRHIQRQGRRHTMEQEDEADRLFITFTAEEVALIVVAIIKGVERKVAISTMPRYSWKQHRVYAAFYDQMKDAIDWAWKNT
jgi:hypothetical protein